MIIIRYLVLVLLYAIYFGISIPVPKMDIWYVFSRSKVRCLGSSIRSLLF